MKQRINIGISIEMDAADVARILNDELRVDLARAAGIAAMAMVPRSVDAYVAGTTVNPSRPYIPGDEL